MRNQFHSRPEKVKLDHAAGRLGVPARMRHASS